MWTNISIILLLVLFFVALGWMKQKEGFDNPTTMSQSQQGDIASLRKQLKQITITSEGLTEVEDSISELSDQTNTLRENVPDGQVQQYAPE
jgi:biopolymer transport protein ExbD